MNKQKHITVLLDEAVNGLQIKPDGIYLDGTFGRGGHSRLILSQLGDNGKLIAIDRDPDAVNEALKINDHRFSIIHGTFSNMDEYIQEMGLTGQIDGVLLDLGVSSPQLDEANRGFSFMREGPLDMRMNPTEGMSAAQWLLKAEETDIAWVLKNYGEERFAKRIARAIIERNKADPLKTTKELADLIYVASPIKEKHKHPATRSFQAIRIFINRELEEIEKGLNAALAILKPQGRLSVISFHSLEDRIVKQFIKKQSHGPVLPKGLPLTEEQIKQYGGQTLISITKLKPAEQEIVQNPRARSSVLRIAEKAKA